MSENTAIEWADHTFNPWTGCQVVSPDGCKNCYAATWAKRAGRDFAVRQRTKTWGDPVKWNSRHTEFFEVHGRRQRVFCASLADVFDNQVPEQWRWDLFRLIDATPHLDWLLLTKRIGNARDMLNSAASAVVGEFVGANVWDHQPWPNIWLGATVVNQEEADRDIPKLLALRARVRFLSIEPMLGPIDLQRSCTIRCPNGDCQPHSSGHRVVVDSESGGTLIECFCSRLNGLHWVICGGESGPGARPMSREWARSLRDQASAAGVPFLFKQWGEWAPARSYATETPGRFAYGDYEHAPQRFIQTDRYPRAFTSFGARAIVEWRGKKAAGRLLDGAEHNGFPACN